MKEYKISENKKFREQLVEKQQKKEKKGKIIEISIMAFGIISIMGSFISLLFLSGITGGAIGVARENLYGLIFIMVFLMMWSLAGVLYSKKKRKKKVDIKKLLKESGR